MRLNLKEVLENVKQWVYEIGEYQLKKLEESFKCSTKSTETDMVTEVDQYSDKFFVDKISELYPEHSILSEEEGNINGGNEYEWIIDPLDGTNNYVHRFPIHSISVALQRNKNTILGVIYVPRLNELFYAVKGEGAYLNNKRITVSNARELNKCLLVTGFPYDKHISEHNNLGIFNKILPLSQGCRRTGSSAFDLSSVACGRVDGYWELKLSKWDIAAGTLLIEEAGGVVCISNIEKLGGELGYNIICGNKFITDKLKYNIDAISDYFN